MPNHYFVGDHEYFPGIGNISYEGRESDNPLAFKFYQCDRLVGGEKRCHYRSCSMST